MTDFSRLLDTGRIKRGRFSPKQVRECLRIAKRDIQTAQGLLKSSPEWAFNITYNAMHQAGRAYLFHKGYRTAGQAHHATVIQFLELDLGAEYEEGLMLMDRMRRKRNRATYDMVGTISRKEAKEAISAAAEFVAEITRLVKPSRK